MRDISNCVVEWMYRDSLVESPDDEVENLSLWEITRWARSWSLENVCE